MVCKCWSAPEVGFSTLLTLCTCTVANIYLPASVMDEVQEVWGQKLAPSTLETMVRTSAFNVQSPGDGMVWAWVLTRIASPDPWRQDSKGQRWREEDL